MAIVIQQPLQKLPTRFDFGRLSSTMTLVAGIMFSLFQVGPLSAAPLPQEVPPDADTEKQDSRSAGLDTDRKTLVTLSSFEMALAEGRLNDALDDFRRLQTSDPATMVPASPDSPTFAPLYRVLFDAFYRLPTEIRRQEAARSDAVAVQILHELLADGTLEQIPELILQSPGSHAAIQAHLIIARNHRARGQQIAARAWLIPLLSQHIPEPFRALARSIVEHDPQEKRPETEGADPEPAEPVADREIPSHLQWQFRAVASPRLSKQLAVFQQSARQSRAIAETTWSDVFSGESVYRRTMRGIAAIDTRDGSAAWQYPLFPNLDRTLSDDPSNSSLFGTARLDSDLSSRFPQLQQSQLADVFCRDNVLSRISADEHRLYLIALEPLATAKRVIVNRGIRSTTSRYGAAKIVALDKASGRRIWSLGDEAFREFIGEKSDSCWISGVPFASRNRLYCVFEWNGAMRLASISAGTGEVIWTSVLAYPDQSIDKDGVRRLWGATPRIEGGLIWCPTTTGWTVCLDDVTRTVLWASRLSSAAPPRTGNVARGRPVAMTPTAAIADRWPAGGLRRHGDTLVVIPHESHEIALLNALTGEAKHRIKVKPSAVLAYADAEQLVISESGSVLPGQSPSDAGVLRAVSVATGDELWTRTLTKEGGVPTGGGMPDAGALLLPMSNGTISRVHLKTGAQLAVTDVILPVNGWGHLTGSGDDVYYSAPDILFRIGGSPPVTRPQNAVEIATVLSESQKWSAALESLDEVKKSDPLFAAASALRFRCLRELAIRDTPPHLDALRAAAGSPDQILTADVLEVRQLRVEARFGDAVRKLVALLKRDAASYSQPVPGDLAARSAAAGSGSLPATTQPLLTWISQNLTEILVVDSASADIMEPLSELSLPLLLSIDHDSVRPLIHKAIEDGPMSQSHLAALHRSTALARNSDGTYADLSFEVDRFVEYLNDVPAKADGPGRAVRSLLNAMLFDQPEPFVTAVLEKAKASDVELLSLAAMENDFRKKITASYSKWKSTPYVVEPVSRTASPGRRLNALTPAFANDPFLRQYRWSAFPGNHGRIKATQKADPADQWSVPGSFDVQNSYSIRNDMLHRVGGIILLQSYRGLTAVSVIDEKILWAQSPGSTSYTTFSSTRNTGFEQFVAGRDRLPSFISTMSFIVGAGQDWVCTRTGKQLEMRDLQSGETVWSMELEPQFNQVIATDDVVIVTGTSSTQAVVCLSRRFGTVIDVPDAKSLAARAIRNVGELLVCWHPSENGNPHGLQWIEPMSGKIVRQVPLTDMKRFQFLDDETLTGFNDEQQMLMVDLRRGGTQSCSFPVSDDDMTGTEEAVAGQPAPAKMWSAQRLQIAGDSLNYYVTNPTSQIPIQARQPSGLPLKVFRGGVKAINRQTGNVRWSLANDKVLAAGFHHGDWGFLILVEYQPLEGQPGSLGANVLFRGITRMGGKDLFEQSLLCPSGLRYASIRSTKANSIDINVYGQKIRVKVEETAEPLIPSGD